MHSDQGCLGNSETVRGHIECMIFGPFELDVDVVRICFTGEMNGSCLGVNILVMSHGLHLPCSQSAASQPQPLSTFAASEVLTVVWYLRYLLSPSS